MLPRHRLLSASVARGEDHVQRHQRLQRMRAGFDERTDVLADEPAFADVDHLLGRSALFAVEVVFHESDVR